jgi:CRP-like cAMP-binding protein
MTGKTLSADILRQIPIFKGMNDTERRQLAEMAAVIPFREGDLVLAQGRTSQNLWIVLEGECEVFKDADAAASAGVTAGPSIRLALLTPYSNFGEMSFFHPAAHSASVRAATAVSLLRIERADYNELVAEGASAAHKLACNAIDSLAERLRRMDEWVAELMRAGQATAAAVQAAAPPGAPASAGGPPVGQPSPHIAEWDRFRDKLFAGWNL